MFDATLGRSENAVFCSGSDNYDGIYQYDTLGWISNGGYGTNTAWFANVFTAAANTKIVAASWYAPAANSTYEVYVHVNPSNGPMGTQASYSATIGIENETGTQALLHSFDRAGAVVNNMALRFTTSAATTMH